MASATGSKVAWSITEGSGLTQVTVAPLAGSLSAGVSQTIGLTLSNPLAGGKPGANSSLVVTSGTLTISPGGIVVTVNIVVGANGIPGALGPASLPGRPALAGRLVD
jgi:hypothetical protein